MLAVVAVQTPDGREERILHDVARQFRVPASPVVGERKDRVRMGTKPPLDRGRLPPNQFPELTSIKGLFHCYYMYPRRDSVTCKNCEFRREP